MSISTLIVVLAVAGSVAIVMILTPVLVRVRGNYEVEVNELLDQIKMASMLRGYRATKTLYFPYPVRIENGRIWVEYGSYSQFSQIGKCVLAPVRVDRTIMLSGLVKVSIEDRDGVVYIRLEG